MRYGYKNKETGCVIEREFPITDKIPSEITVEGKVYKRMWGGASVHIPDGWGENQIRFDKSPSRRKHFY